MTRALTSADKAILATQHAGAVLKAVLDLKRFQREHDAQSILLEAAQLFNPAQCALLTNIVLAEDL